MLKMINAHTQETDDVQSAVAEVLEQLDLENGLLRNTVGLISCHPDFIKNGIVAALCAKLPFDVVGTTALGNAVNGRVGFVQLCLSILTADDVEFHTAISAPLGEAKLGGITEAYAEASAGLPQPPELVIALLPFIRNIGGERMLKELDVAAGGRPIFGMVTSEAEAGMPNCHTIYRGEVYRESVALLLVSGNVQPKFFVASLSRDRVQKQRAVITKARGNLVEQINDMSVKDYLRSIGLYQGEGIESLQAIPFVFDLNDGTKPVTWAIYLVTEEGYVACGGDVPVNATLAVGELEKEDVLQTAMETTAEAKRSVKNCALLFPCLGRNMVLGLDPFAEIEVVEGLLGESTPYHLAYANGELCPVYTEAGDTTNRFHNFTFIMCTL